MNIIFDGNYLYHKTFSIFATYYNNEDLVEVLSDKEKQQILIRKCVTDMCFALSKFSNIDKVIFVFDSKSWRYNYYDDYKYSLTKVRQPYYQSFLNVMSMFETLLMKKGIIVSKVQGAEGDDLIYIWSLYFTEVVQEQAVVISGDSDLRQIINQNVSIFNNNSKNLKMFCDEYNEETWNCYLDTNIEVVPVNPVEVLLFKVIMGDTSDNIPKLKKGFGEKAFQNFIKEISPLKKSVLESHDLVSVSQWILSKFSVYAKMDEVELLGKIIFNLKMTWLNISVYQDGDYITYDGRSLLENMLNNVLEQKDKYSYNKKYTLEQFYGLLIQ